MLGDNDDFGAGGDFRIAPDYAKNSNNEQGQEMANDDKINEYMRALLREKLTFDREKHPIAAKLLDREITRAQSERVGLKGEPKFVNVYRDKPVKITCRVLVPLKDHPRFNFVGKLLGPKGNSFKRLQEETMCRMAILGRGSMRDREKEEELRNSLDIKYAHLAEDLHVEISALGPPAEAYARIAFALTELRKYLTPDVSDDISQEQLREMEIFEEQSGGPKGRPGGPPGPPRRLGPGMRGPPRGHPANRMLSHRGKANVLSILDRARAAMQNNYEEGFEEPYEPEHMFDSYAPGPTRAGFGGNRYGASSYNADYYEDTSSAFAENQRWKPYKTGGAAARTEQPRYRPTPYSRGGK